MKTLEELKKEWFEKAVKENTEVIGRGTIINY